MWSELLAENTSRAAALRTDCIAGAITSTVMYPAKTRGMALLYGENCMILTPTVFD